MIAVLVVSHLLLAVVCLLVGRLSGWRQSFACGYERGRRAVQSEHNLPADPIPGGHRRRWASRNRKQPEPSGLTTTGFTEADRLFRH